MAMVSICAFCETAVYEDDDNRPYVELSDGETAHADCYDDYQKTQNAAEKQPKKASQMSAYKIVRCSCGHQYRFRIKGCAARRAQTVQRLASAPCPACYEFKSRSERLENRSRTQNERRGFYGANV
jgi:hypothetical protein